MSLRRTPIDYVNNITSMFPLAVTSRPTRPIRMFSVMSTTASNLSCPRGYLDRIGSHWHRSCCECVQARFGLEPTHPIVYISSSIHPLTHPPTSTPGISHVLITSNLTTTRPHTDTLTTGRPIKTVESTPNCSSPGVACKQTPIVISVSPPLSLFVV